MAEAMDSSINETPSGSRLCTSHCSCVDKRYCKNECNSVEPTTTINSESDEVHVATVTEGMAALTTSDAPTGSTDLAETSTIVSTTTRGGCSFDALIKGEKNYCCDPSCLLDLEKEVATKDEKGARLSERVITNRRVKRLIDHVNGIFIAFKKADKKVKKFYIGKTYIEENEKNREKFDTMKPSTWTVNGITSRWHNTYNNIRKDYKCDGLIVLTVVTKELLPPRLNASKKERYTLLLEQRLIQYYQLENRDRRLGNKTFNEGKNANREDIEYVLYVAVKFKEKT